MDAVAAAAAAGTAAAAPEPATASSNRRRRTPGARRLRRASLLLALAGAALAMAARGQAGGQRSRGSWLIPAAGADNVGYEGTSVRGASCCLCISRVQFESRTATRDASLHMHAWMHAYRWADLIHLTECKPDDDDRDDPLSAADAAGVGAGAKAGAESIKPWYAEAGADGGLGSGTYVRLCALFRRRTGLCDRFQL